ncbi:MAG: ArsR/SmtB family transcription factor [Candidatus Dormibacteraceae bacterium]
MDDDDLTFKALADPTRRLLLDALEERDGRTLSDLEETAPQLTRFGVMKHLRVLEEAGLVVARKEGRYRYHHLNAVPIQRLYDRWIDKYRARRAAALLDLKQLLEEQTMSTATTPTASATQVYQLYIRATQEQVWDAITNPAVVVRFFHGAQIESTYQQGASIRSLSPDRSRVWGENTILEIDPPRRLVQTWRSLYDPELAAEPESRVTWEVDPVEGGYARLTLTHDQLDASPKTAASVRGWSYILSNLKTLLETGDPLPPAPE